MPTDMRNAIGGKCGCVNCKPRSVPAAVKKAKVKGKSQKG